MPLWKHKAYNLTESDIRYAMRNSKSNWGAARFLGISYSTYKRYAKMYVDSESGKTLWDLHKNMGGKGIKSKTSGKYTGARGLREILEGKHPRFPAKLLKKRLIHEGFKAECCEECGFDERRITDYTVPLILVWLDGNKYNHKYDNLKLLCYNCFYLTYGNLFGAKSEKLKLEGYNE